MPRIPTAVTLVLVLAVVPPAGAQTPAPAPPLDSLTPIKSMGQPRIWKPYGGAFYETADSSQGQPALGAGMVGVYKDLLMSSIGLGMSGEGYVGGSARGLEGGVRALADIRGIGVKVGVDYDLRDKSASLILSLSVPLRRGGIVGHGSFVRVDWLPGRSWNFGLSVPFEPHMGKTRPRDTQVTLPQAPRSSRRAPDPEPDPRIAAALARVRQAVRWVQTLTHVFWDDHRDNRIKSLERTRREIAQFKAQMAERDALHPNGHNLANEVEILHDQLARAFGLAAGEPDHLAQESGEAIAARARAAMLEGVILPYDRLFGQFKRHDSLLGLGAQARAGFAAWVRDGSGLPAARQDEVFSVFDGYLAALEYDRATSVNHLDVESRGVWLPLQLALRPEQHDTQAEIDALIERAVGRPFSDGNTAVYMSGQQFQVELNRTIHQAEDYHVLWVHDYCGVNLSKKDIDEVGLYQAVDGYLDALTQRVKEFDRTGKLPVYLILVDMYYYEDKKGRIFMSLLEDPLGHRVRFPPGFEEMEGRVERAQLELRQAVAGSRRLQAAAVVRGQDWLRQQVKVHVSVTNPVDFSFRTRRIARYLPIVPDHVIRDHRKIVFRDVTELDPGRGEALFTGVSVGAQYASPTWEDRTLLATGPAILYLKEAIRRYLRANGFKEEEIPPPLRVLPKPPDYAEKVRRLETEGATAKVLQVHNERGFAQKDATVVNAILYTLLPPGSVIIVPDPIWTSMAWAGQLVGAALRGCRVYVIAPSRDNAPSAGFPPLSRSREVLSRFVEIERMLGPEIEAAGGRLRTGLYTRETSIGDVAGRLREVGEGYRENPFLKDEFPLPPSIYDSLDHAPRLVDATAIKPQPLAVDALPRKPMLHRKTQFFATGDSLRALASRPEVQQLLRAHIAGQITSCPEGLALPGWEHRGLLAPLLEAQASLPADLRARSIYYLTVGSPNKDLRSMVLDGEVLMVLSSDWSLWGYTDFFFLMGTTTWIETQEQLDALLPPYTQFQRRLGRWFRKAV